MVPTPADVAEKINMLTDDFEFLLTGEEIKKLNACSTISSLEKEVRHIVKVHFDDRPRRFHYVS